MRRADTSDMRDAADIASLIAFCREEKTTVLDAYTPGEELAFLRGVGDREAVFVAEAGGGFVGFSGVSPRGRGSHRHDHCGEMGTWVVPGHRGKGVGRELYRAVERFALSCSPKLTHLGAQVLADNTRSIAFYEAMGFRVLGRHVGSVLWDGELKDTVEIEKLLV